MLPVYGIFLKLTAVRFKYLKLRKLGENDTIHYSGRYSQFRGCRLFLRIPQIVKPIPRSENKNVETLPLGWVGDSATFNPNAVGVAYQ